MRVRRHIYVAELIRTANMSGASEPNGGWVASRDESGRAGDVPRQSTTYAAAQRHLATRRRREVRWRAFDLARAGGTTERRPCSVARNQVERLRRIERRWSRLAHIYYLATATDPGTMAPVRLVTANPLIP